MRAWWTFVHTLGFWVHESHGIFRSTNAESRSECWRFWAWRRWMTDKGTLICAGRRGTHHDRIHPMNPSSQEYQRRRDDVEMLRLFLLIFSIIFILGISWRLWEQAFVRSLPGAHGEPLPRDWRAK